MSRLIDADVLIESIVNRAGSETVLYNTTEELNAYLEGCVYKQNAIIDIINDLQTAYDVESVMAELEHQKEQCEKDMKYYEEKSWKDHISHTNYDLFYAQSDCWEDAIDIVRKGGIE